MDFDVRHWLAAGARLLIHDAQSLRDGGGGAAMPGPGVCDQE